MSAMTPMSMISTMSIAITDDHLALAATVADVLTKQDARAAARELLESADEPMPGVLGRTFADLGWLGLHLPEDVGGSGFGYEVVVVVLRSSAGR